MKAGIFGAGQAGLMAATWLPANQKLVCYIDNNLEKQGTSLGGIPVCSLNESLELELDLILIAMLNQDARMAVKNQLLQCGYRGEILDVQDYRKNQDIRLSALRLATREIWERQVPGDLVELGVYRGDFAREMNRLFPERKLYLFDTFEGFKQQDIAAEENLGKRGAKPGDFADTSIELVREKLDYPEQAIFCPGHFPESMQTVSEELTEIALVSLDPDLYEPTLQGLRIFYPRLQPGGMILIHDYNSMQFPGVHRAVREFCEEEGVYVVPLMDLHGTAILMRQIK